MNRTALRAIVDLAHRTGVWIDRRRTRELLRSLDDRALRDLGLSRLDAWQEARKPFWRA